MKTLLEKTRAMNDLVQRSAGQPVDFKDMARTLSEVIYWGMHFQKGAVVT